MDFMLSCLLSLGPFPSCDQTPSLRADTAFALPAPGERRAPASPPADTTPDEPETSRRKPYRLHLDLPLLDEPDHSSLLPNPSMRQSLMLTKDAYYLAHLPAMELARTLGGGEWLAVGLVDIGLSFLPLGSVWLHEEWHRAVLNRRGIASKNGVYDFDFERAGTPVRAVRDEDLSQLKREHPAEMVRLSSAGFEAGYTLSLELDKDRFFRATRGAVRFQQWLDLLGSIAYLSSAAYDSERATREFARGEGTDIEQRDFTGLDPVAWVYDLHRPDEAYEARGPHPSGVGIDRYRSESDLSSGELRYLRLQSWLNLLNLADPQLLGFDAFEFETDARDRVRWNASVQHFMAPFGSSTNLNVFLQVNSWSWFLQLHAHASNGLILPGLTAELVRPGPLGGTITPSVRLWLQPEEQRFYARSAQLGGAAELRTNIPLGGAIELYSLLGVKSEGWIAGNEFLDAEFSIGVGFEAVAF